MNKYSLVMPLCVSISIFTSCKCHHSNSHCAIVACGFRIPATRPCPFSPHTHTHKETHTTFHFLFTLYNFNTSFLPFIALFQSFCGTNSLLLLHLFYGWRPDVPAFKPRRYIVALTYMETQFPVSCAPNVVYVCLVLFCQ